MIACKDKVVKKNLLWFNPWNDLALAFGGANYTPPKAGVELARNMSWLPMLWAEEGDVVAYDGELPDWVAQLPLKGRRWDGSWEGIDRCEPWGWSHAARKQLRRMGAPEEILPSLEQLDRWRWLSHRRTTIPFLKEVEKGASSAGWKSGRPRPDTAGWKSGRPRPDMPREVFLSTRRRVDCHSEVSDRGRSDFHPTLSTRGRVDCHPVVIKAPWSTAGRGVLDSTSMSWEELKRRAEGMMRRQGSVMVEPRLDKVLDFALLYRSTDAGVEYLGPSLFVAENGVYRGGKVAPVEELEAEIASHATPEELEWVKEAARAALEAVRTDYRGYVGVDMMVHRMKDGAPGIHPCVEINWRCTMGVPALALSRMGVRGFFKPEL